MKTQRLDPLDGYICIDHYHDLQSENQRLRRALEDLLECEGWDDYWVTTTEGKTAVSEARKALEVKP